MQPVLVKPKVSPQKAGQIARTLDLPMDEISALIKHHEGFKPKPYRDIYKKWTIGYGTLIGDGSDAALESSQFKGRTLSQKEAFDIAMGDIRKKADLAASDSQLGPVFAELSPKLKAHVVSGYYRGDLSGSPKAKQLIRQRKFAEAADEFLDSDEYRAAKKAGTGVAPRMEQTAAALREEAESKKSPDFLSAVEKRLSR